MSNNSSTGPIVAVFVFCLLLAVGGGGYWWQRMRVQQMVLAQQAMLRAEQAKLASEAAAQNARQAEKANAQRNSTLRPIQLAKSGADAASPETIIRDKLTAQQNSWNAGNIDQFMEVYWKSDQLTFASGGKVTRGWQATLDGYKTRYPDKATMGQLKFDELEFKPIGTEVMLVIGNWHLDRENSIGGKFSLIWQQLDGQWQIVHDHTSLNSP